MASSPLKVGDWVEVANDIEIVQQLQENHGGWNDRMKNILGQKGMVITVYSAGDLCVKVNRDQWTLNPACCAPCNQPNAETVGTDDDFVRMMQTLSEGVLAVILKAKDAQYAAGTRQTSESEQQFSTVDTAAPASNLVNRDENVNVDLISELLGHGTSINAKDEHGDTYLHRAVRRDDEEKIRLLLQNGAAIDERNAMGSTALHLAVSKQSLSSVSILLQHVCDVNIEDDDGNTALHKAVEEPNADVMGKLLNHECANHGIKNKLGFNVLQYAASCGNVRAVKDLLQLTPHLVELKNVDGLTPLHVAVAYGHCDVAVMLINEGKANTELRNDDGQTPLLLAVSLGHPGMVDVLVELGADILAQDNEGNTCLHYAVMAADKASQSDNGLLHYLLNRGADISKKNHAGQCAIDAASTDAVKRVLLEYVSDDQAVGHAAARNTELARASAGEVTETERLRQMEQQASCPLCVERRRDTAFDCGHTVCGECATRINQCAECRKPIERRLQLYF